MVRAFRWLITVGLGILYVDRPSKISKYTLDKKVLFLAV